MNRPVIGIVPLWDETKDSLWMLPGYMNGIEQAGGLPVMLPLSTDESVLEQVCRLYNGFLFTGGHDISPGLYGEDTNERCEPVCSERDEMESLLFSKAVIDLDKPTFGICRGIQFINALLGGTLYQDLPAQYSKGLNHKQAPPYKEPSHRAMINPGSPLQTLLGTDTIAVNSCHHQGIKELSRELICMATAEDGLVEAVYMPGRSFVWAVQWHPEYSLQDKESRQLFEAFVTACRN